MFIDGLVIIFRYGDIVLYILGVLSELFYAGSCCGVVNVDCTRNDILRRIFNKGMLNSTVELCGPTFGYFNGAGILVNCARGCVRLAVDSYVGIHDKIIVE